MLPSFFFVDRVNPEQHEVARQRALDRLEELKLRQESNSIHAIAAPVVVVRSNSDGPDEQAEDASFTGNQDANVNSSNHLAGALDAAQAREIDVRQRVRTPYTTGFYFTVRPESKVQQSVRPKDTRDVSIDLETGEERRIGRGAGNR
jgi:hypothetical protein